MEDNKSMMYIVAIIAVVAVVALVVLASGTGRKMMRTGTAAGDDASTDAFGNAIARQGNGEVVPVGPGSGGGSGGGTPTVVKPKITEMELWAAAYKTQYLSGNGGSEINLYTEGYTLTSAYAFLGSRIFCSGYDPTLQKDINVLDTQSLGATLSVLSGRKRIHGAVISGDSSHLQSISTVTCEMTTELLDSTIKNAYETKTEEETFNPNGYTFPTINSATGIYKNPVNGKYYVYIDAQSDNGGVCASNFYVSVYRGTTGEVWNDGDWLNFEGCPTTINAFKELRLDPTNPGTINPGDEVFLRVGVSGSESIYTVGFGSWTVPQSSSGFKSPRSISGVSVNALPTAATVSHPEEVGKFVDDLMKKNPSNTAKFP